MGRGTQGSSRKKAKTERTKQRFLKELEDRLLGSPDRERAKGKAEAESAIARRLAEKFEATGNFFGCETEACAADVGWWLDIREDEVEQLFDLGLLKTHESGYSLRRTTVFEVERFLAANPWWFRVRAQKNREAFSERLERARKGGPSDKQLAAIGSAMSNLFAHVEKTKAEKTAAA